jgi:phosphatidate cytidylyltransferase
MLILAMLLIVALQLTHPQRPDGALTGSATGLLTVAYLGLTATCLGWLRLWPQGSLGIRLLIFFMVAIWLGDSGAYYVGKHLGRHRMSPKISPKKTWEGLIACVVTTLLAATAMKLLFLDLAWPHIIAMGLILGLLGPLGDLVESQLKRDTGVKDSSTLIPGHGGLLDRTDSLFFAAPPVLGYLLLTGII